AMAYIGAILAGVGAVGAGILYIRFAFVFPALTIGRFNGLGPAWRQTAGNFEALLAVLVLVYAPYMIPDALIRFNVNTDGRGLTARLALVVQILIGMMSMCVIAIAPSLAYRWIVLGAGRQAAAASVAVRA